MRLHRLFALLDEFRTRRRPVSASQLAGTLGVSERTIYRDIAALRGMGAPIRGEAGVGYQLEPGFFLPPLAFDADERDALVLGLSMLVRDAGLDTALVAAARRVIAKIEATAPDNHTLDSPLAALGHAPVPTGFADFRRAVEEKLKIWMSYCPEDGPTTRRTVHPLALTAFDPGWLLTAWCELRDDFRDFRLDRVHDYTITETPFVDRKGQRFADYVAQL